MSRIIKVVYKGVPYEITTCHPEFSKFIALIKLKIGIVDSNYCFKNFSGKLEVIDSSEAFANFLRMYSGGLATMYAVEKSDCLPQDLDQEFERLSVQRHDHPIALNLVSSSTSSKSDHEVLGAKLTDSIPYSDNDSTDSVENIIVYNPKGNFTSARTPLNSEEVTVISRGSPNDTHFQSLNTINKDSSESDKSTASLRKIGRYEASRRDSNMETCRPRGCQCGVCLEWVFKDLHTCAECSYQLCRLCASETRHPHVLIKWKKLAS